MISARALCLLAIILLPVVSCTNGDDDDDGEDVSVAQALLACDLITDGELGGLGNPRDPYETCVAQCVSADTCEALELFVCGPNPGDQALLDTCYTQCLAPHGHACAGQLFPPKYVCDGYNDCMNGSDEAKCPADFVCGDGEPLPPAYRCDQELHCDDASDEIDCPTATTFACASGELIPASFQCNFVADCEDGSDEADAHGCAQLTCPGAGA